MASSNRCSTCKTSAGTCICAGCMAYFCEKDLKKHRGILLHELDELLEDSQIYQDKLNKTTQHNECINCLLSRIAEWQRITIDKVTQSAEEARKEVINLMESKRMGLTSQYETFSQELNEMRETEDIIEQDLTRLKEVIYKLNEDLKQLSESSMIELDIEQGDQIAWTQLINVKDKSANIGGQQCQQISTIDLTPPISRIPLTSSENIEFSLMNNEKSQPQFPEQISITKEEKTSAESSSSNAASKHDNKPFILENLTSLNGTSGSTFANASLASSNNTNSSSDFPSFHNTITSSTGFQFSMSSASFTTAKTNPTFLFGSTAAPANKLLSDSTPRFSFSELTKQFSSLENDKLASGSVPQRALASPDSSGSNTSSVSSKVKLKDTLYEPIVELSPVKVKTGEEDENIIFCERAKLYRFDSSTNQMKERGIGEMKILQHKTTKLCRILMRREQVLKLCANHRITSQMELKPHQTSENTYVWSAMDFADGQATSETLCVRFKSSDIAKRFIKQFDEAKQTNTKV